MNEDLIRAKSTMAKPTQRRTDPVADMPEGTSLVLTVTSKRYTALSVDDSAEKTIGMMVDEALKDAAFTGATVQTIALHIAEDDWTQMSNRIRNHSRDPLVTRR